MDKLSELQKQIVQMKLTGKDYSEMSEELGVTHSQIHKNIKKAYDKIRHYVRKNETLMLILHLYFHFYIISSHPSVLNSMIIPV